MQIPNPISNPKPYLITIGVIFLLLLSTCYGGKITQFFSDKKTTKQQTDISNAAKDEKNFDSINTKYRKLAIKYSTDSITSFNTIKSKDATIYALQSKKNDNNKTEESKTPEQLKTDITNSENDNLLKTAENVVNGNINDSLINNLTFENTKLKAKIIDNQQELSNCDIDLQACQQAKQAEVKVADDFVPKHPKWHNFIGGVKKAGVFVITGIATTETAILAAIKYGVLK